MSYDVRVKNGLATLEWLAESINEAIKESGKRITENELVDILVENNEVYKEEYYNCVSG